MWTKYSVKSAYKAIVMAHKTINGGKDEKAAFFSKHLTWLE